MRARFRLAAAALAIVSTACASPVEWGAERIELADLVVHQAGNVTTQLVWPARGMGTERLRRGWRIAPEAQHFEMAGRWSALHLFSADGTSTKVEIDARLGEDVQAAEPKLLARLNGTEVGELALEGGRRAYELTLPAEATRRGRNLLEFQLRPPGLRAQGERGSAFHLYRLAIHPSGSRAIWAERPAEIRVAPADRAIELPAPAFLDVVARIAAPARFEARVSGRFPSDRGSRDVELYAELLDAGGETHNLYRRELRRGERTLQLDLTPWLGQLVRLRVGAGGEGNALVSLAGATLSGSATLFAEDSSPAATSPTGGAGGATHIEEAATPRLERPDVLFLLLDAARADAFGCYGGPHPTPAVDSLAAAGTRFSRALSAAPWTGQSVPSVFTGLYPDSVGIEHWGSRLPATATTLAERLTEAGYRTLLWSQHPFYRSRGDLKRGFELFASAPDNDRQTLPDADLLFDPSSPDKPVFAFLHLLPPHTPYAPPAPFLGSRTGWYGGDTPVDAPFLNRFPDREDPASLSTDDLRYIRERYQENTVFADSLVGRLVQLLRQNGRYDDALIVVLADHGEAFLEHDRFMHGQKVYREFIHVPLIVKWPGGVDGFRPVVDATVSLVDLAPTLLDALGLSASGPFQGESLLPAVFLGHEPARAIYATTRTSTDPNRPTRIRTTLESAGWKLVWDGETLETELYRLADDADELQDLSAQYPLETLLLEQMLLMRRAIHHQTLAGFGGESAGEAIDPETEERLRALGYL